MSDRPSWWDQVKEVDREEAEVLFRLGLPVWCDWPVLRPNGSGVKWQRYKNALYYTLKGEALE